MFESVKQNEYALEFSAPALKADRGIVFETVKQIGNSFEHAAPELKADREFILKAAKQNDRSLYHARQSPRVREFMGEAVDFDAWHQAEGKPRDRVCSREAEWKFT